MLWSLGKEVCSLLGSGIVPLDQQQQFGRSSPRRGFGAAGVRPQAWHGKDSWRIPSRDSSLFPRIWRSFWVGKGNKSPLLHTHPGLLLGSGLWQRQDGQSQRCLCSPGNNTEPTDVPGEMSALFVHPCPSSAAWEQPGPRIPHSQPIPALLEAAPGSMEGIKGGLGASPGLEQGMIPGNRCRWSREIHSAEPQPGAVVGPHPFPSTGTQQGRAMQPGSPALLNSSRPRDTKGFHLNSGQR